MQRRVDYSLRGAAPATWLLAAALVGQAQAQTQPAAPAQPPPAVAQPAPAVQPSAPASPPTPPTPEQQAAAREAYGRGQAAFAEGRFADARTAFGEAYAAVSNPVVLLPIAEAETALEDFAAARRTLRRYLELRPDAPDRAEVERKIAELETHPGRLSIASEPPGAALHINGTERTEVTPAELVLPVGAYHIELSLPGRTTGTADVEVEPGGRRELHLELGVAAPVPLIAATPSLAAAAATPQEPKDESPTTALWVCGIIGASGMITGTVLGFLALDEHADFKKNPTVESADRGEKLALFADVSFAVGAMALITGAVLYLTVGGDEPAQAAPAKPAPSARLRLTPHFAPGTAAASARVSF